MSTPHHVTTMLLACCAALPLTGCFGTDEPAIELLPLTGQIMFNGNPGDHIALTFLPKRNTRGEGGWAVSDDKGLFVAKQYSGEEGLAAGEYNIQFSRMRTPDGKLITSQGDGGPESPRVETLARPFVQPNPDNNPFVVTVPSPAEVVFKVKGQAAK